METFQKAMIRVAGPVGIIGTVGGFVSDVLAPLGELAPWVAGFSLLLALITVLGFISRYRQQGEEAWDSPVAAGLLISTASTVIFAAWTLILAAGPERGYLAENIEPIGQLQAQLLNIEADITQIKETTTETADQVASAATAQAQGFANIQAAFAELQINHTIIPNPNTPQAWYNNARVYQLRGDTTNAIQAYEGYAAFNLDFVDPYAEYISLLKATEGIVRTRQIINNRLKEYPDNPALMLASISLLDTPEEQIAQLTPLTERLPRFGPGFLALGQAYDLFLLDTDNLTNQRLSQQQATYKRLFELEAEQDLSRYYIDKNRAETQLMLARQMFEAYSNAAQIFQNVDIQVSHYYNGVLFLVVVAEAYTAQQLLFSIDDPQPNLDTGKTAAGEQTLINMMIGPVPVEIGDHIFYTQYIDANGLPSSVYSTTFRVDPIAINFFQGLPNFSTGTIPARFDVGVLGRQGDEPYTFHYSVDSDVLDQSTSGTAVYSITIDDASPGEHTLYIQAISAIDTQQTEVVAFPFKIEN